MLAQTTFFKKGRTKLKLNSFLEMSFWGQIFIFKTARIKKKARILTHTWKDFSYQVFGCSGSRNPRTLQIFHFDLDPISGLSTHTGQNMKLTSSILNNICWENSLTILKANLFTNISEPAFMLFLTMPYYCLHWSVVWLVKIAWLPLDFIFH